MSWWIILLILAMLTLFFPGLPMLILQATSMICSMVWSTLKAVWKAFD